MRSGAVQVCSVVCTAEEAIARRPEATALAVLKTAHWCPEKCGELLMHEVTKMAGTKVAREGESGIKGNQTSSYLTLLSCW